MTIERLRLRLTATDGRPRLSLEMVRELRAALQTAEGIVTLEGQSGHFCEGLDVAILATNSAASSLEGLTAYRELLAALAAHPHPTVALVDGEALGGGLGLASAADMIIATPSSTFGLPDVLIGMIPAVIFPHVAARAGAARARLLALGLAPLSAEEAFRWGLVDEIASDLEEAFGRRARRFSRMDRRAMSAVKKLAAPFFDGGDVTSADAQMTALIQSTETRRRVARMAAGEPAWLEDDE